MEGLKQDYGVTFEKSLKFFEIHKSEDVIHREECEKLLNELREAE
jgi:pyrroloquinoline-quinone synthase